MIETLAPVADTASLTVSNTGTPATFLPLPPGVTPDTTFVPYSTIWVVWNEPSRPVMPCTRSRVCLSTRMLTNRSFSVRHLMYEELRPLCRCGDDLTGGLVHGVNRL